jgi:hypothetical protein
MKRLPFFLLFATGALFADTIFTLNTTPLESSSAGPFTLDFQFIDGNGTGDANNTVTLTDFNFGGGSVTAAPGFPIGGVTQGSSPLSVRLTDSSFFNETQLLLTPGSQISFDFAATTNADAAAPDAFTFAILDGSGGEIGTTNPNLNNSLIEVDLPGGSSGLNTILSGSAPGASVTLSAPTVGTVSAVPEPSLGVLTGMVLALIAFARRRDLGRFFAANR